MSVIEKLWKSSAVEMQKHILCEQPSTPVNWITKRFHVQVVQAIMPCIIVH